MSEPTCINLEERFGRRYRIAWEAGGKTKPLWPREEWPWLMELRCHGGKVYPWGGELLQAVTERRRSGAQLRALPCVIHARGVDEVVIRFHVDNIEQVLAILKPYRRRQVSEAEKERLAAMGESFRFGGVTGVQSDLAALESTNATATRASTGGGHAV
jgi:hypothetical protein